MNTTSRFNVLRLRYKTALDAYQTILARHAEALSSGRELSDQDKLDEQRATSELERARGELKAAGIFRLDY